MAVLRAKSGPIDLTLWPYRLSEVGEPSWILTQVELRQKESVSLGTTLSLTREDLAALRSGLNAVATGSAEDFTITTTDDDLIVVLHRLESYGDVAVGFWTGEPYGLMRGYRFVVGAQSLKEFSDTLLADESAVSQPGRLP